MDMTAVPKCAAPARLLGYLRACRPPQGEWRSAQTTAAALLHQSAAVHHEGLQSGPLARLCMHALAIQRTHTQQRVCSSMCPDRPLPMLGLQHHHGDACVHQSALKVSKGKELSLTARIGATQRWSTSAGYRRLTARYPSPKLDSCSAKMASYLQQSSGAAEQAGLAAECRLWAC